ncbi:hypothetical protein LTR12_010998 [Friedmanniomyces endolithicus]|nr:hypothetical protein LTR12_010998 [Friedmanniomyces endolithicus]
MFRRSATPDPPAVKAAPQVIILAGPKRDHIHLDAERSCQRSELIRNEVGALKGRFMGLFGQKSDGVACMIDLHETDRLAWDVYAEYIATDKFANPSMTPHDNLLRTTQCIKLGTRIQDSDFTKAAESCLRGHLDQALAQSGLLERLPPLADVLALLSACPDGTVPLTACKTLVKLATVELETTARAGLEEQRALVARAEAEASKKEQELRRNYRLQESIEKKQEAELMCRNAMQEELTTVRLDRADVADLLRDARDELQEVKTARLQQQILHAATVAKLRKRIREDPHQSDASVLGIDLDNANVQAAETKGPRKRAGRAASARLADEGIADAVVAPVRRSKAASKRKIADDGTSEEVTPPKGCASRKARAATVQSSAGMASNTAAAVAPAPEAVDEDDVDRFSDIFD